MTLRRRCLGCGFAYPPDGLSCPKCGSHAGEVEEVSTVSTAVDTSKAKRSARASERRKA